jgi:hypothetical protein
MISADADWSSGATGIACEAVIAARLRPIANTDAASNFIDFSFQVCRDAAVSNLREQFVSLVTRPAPYQ